MLPGLEAASLHPLPLSPHGLLPASKIVSPYKDISRIGIKARQDGLVLTTSAKTLCPNKVPFTGPGGYEFGGVRFTLELPWWLSSKEPACNAGAAGSRGFDPWVRKIPWRRAWQPTPGYLPEESHGQRNVVGYSPWGHKESDMTEVTKHICLQPQLTIPLPDR